MSARVAAFLRECAGLTRIGYSDVLVARWLRRVSAVCGACTADERLDAYTRLMAAADYAEREGEGEA